MRQRNLPEPPPSVLAQIAQLPLMNTAELEALWHTLFDQPPIATGKRFLERHLAYRLRAIVKFCVC